MGRTRGERCEWDGRNQATIGLGGLGNRRVFSVSSWWAIEPMMIHTFRRYAHVQKRERGGGRKTGGGRQERIEFSCREPASGMKDGGEVARESMPYASSTRSHSASSPRSASPRSTARPPPAAAAVAAAGLPSLSSSSRASRSKDHVGVGGPPRGDRAGPSGRPRPNPLPQRRARPRLAAGRRLPANAIIIMFGKPF